MNSTIELLLLFWLVTIAHSVITTFTASQFGVVTKEISFGFGNTLARRGRYSLRLLPWGGSVKFAITQEGDDPEQAYDTKPVWIRVVILLSAWITLIVLGFLLSPKLAERGLIEAIPQWLSGAAGPFSTGHDLIRSAFRFVDEHSLPDVASMALIKLSSLNLLPFTGLAGFQAIVLILSGGHGEKPWVKRASEWMLLPMLAVMGSWILALTSYAWSWMA